MSNAINKHIWTAGWVRVPILLDMDATVWFNAPRCGFPTKRNGVECWGHVSSAGWYERLYRSEGTWFLVQADLEAKTEERIALDDMGVFIWLHTHRFIGVEAHPQKDGKPTHRMTVAEANTKALQVAKKWGKPFFILSERKQAELIGCSWATWQRTPFYAKAQEKRPDGKRRRTSSPKTQCLTPALEAVTGEGAKDEVLETVARDEALRMLKAEQEADSEPSPLETRPRKIHSRKRL